MLNNFAAIKPFFGQGDTINFAIKRSRNLDKDNSRFKKNKFGIKTSEKENRNRFKSLRIYLKQNWKKVVGFFVFYIMILGAIISIPIVSKFVTDNLKVTNESKTEQEKLINQKILQKGHFEPDLVRLRIWTKM